jgi:tricorn protease
MSHAGFDRLFTVPVQGGFAAAFPLPTGYEGSLSPDSARLAYTPQWHLAFKQFRGGGTSPIWVANLADSSITAIPRDNSNDFSPMWGGDFIYFLSDRDGPVTLFSFDTRSGEVKKLIENEGHDFKNAHIGPHGIVYEQFGSLHVYDLTTHQSREVQVRLAGDFPQLQPHFEQITPERISSLSLSPRGDRALLEAHGEVFTVPAGAGEVRTIHAQPGVAQREPAWSPDGERIAYFSDDSGEYSLKIAEASGRGSIRTVSLGPSPSFYYRPTWSPDSKKIAYSDKHLNLWYVELAHPVPVKVDTDRFDTPMAQFDTSWSPDSRWITYTKQLANHLHGVFLYSLENAQAVQVTDGVCDARYPGFDRNGDNLYLTCSADTSPMLDWFDLSSYGQRIVRNVYRMILRKNLSAPGSQSFGGSTNGAGKTVIDLEGLDERVMPLPVPADDYVALRTGTEGVLYLLGGGTEGRKKSLNDLFPAMNAAPLFRFDLKTGATKQLQDGVLRFALSASGEKLIYQKGEGLFIVDAGAPAESSAEALRLDNVKAWVNPRADWTQMYHEVWRNERDFFYDLHYHGVDLVRAERNYGRLLDGIASLTDLNYLFEEMLGNLRASHTAAFAGPFPSFGGAGAVGLLGADFAVDGDRYRFARVYLGRSWNPEVRGPLAQPGSQVKAGEYLLAVNGQTVSPSDDVYRFFQNTAGKQAVLKVGPNSTDIGSREITVVPIESEGGLRQAAWTLDNRRRVDQLSGGKLAYVYLPDTWTGGFSSFNREYFAQTDKSGAVMDERFNSGGYHAEYWMDYLRRPAMNVIVPREGEPYRLPGAAIQGPKVMLVNEFAGSGGDALAWYFQKAQIGPLVGARTWGGVGPMSFVSLIGGGMVMTTNAANCDLQGREDMENRGVSPEIAVEQDPKLLRQGRDPQLEKAVEVALAKLRQQHPRNVDSRN